MRNNFLFFFWASVVLFTVHSLYFLLVESYDSFIFKMVRDIFAE